MLITPQYRTLNAHLHAKRASYGNHGAEHADRIRAMLAAGRFTTVLDYGCGKGKLVKELECEGYDPAIKEFCTLPKPADIVVALDVMEHIEPDCLDDVLRHISSLCKVAYLVISLRPAQKQLDDGRNAHLIVESDLWWKNKLRQFFKMVKTIELKPNYELTVLCC